MIDIYHGSPNVIEHPVFGAGKLYNDYGRGFYCTEHVELAKEWACSSDNDGYANHYQLDMTGLRVLNLNEARGKYRQIASKPMAENEIYIIDIIRNNWKNGQGI